MANQKSEQAVLIRDLFEKCVFISVDCIYVAFIHDWTDFQENIPALGFSPLVNTVAKLHDHDEYVNAETYLTGVKIYTALIAEVAYV